MARALVRILEREARDSNWIGWRPPRELYPVAIEVSRVLADAGVEFEIRLRGRARL